MLSLQFQFEQLYMYVRTLLTDLVSRWSDICHVVSSTQNPCEHTDDRIRENKGQPKNPISFYPSHSSEHTTTLSLCCSPVTYSNYMFPGGSFNSYTSIDYLTDSLGF